MTPRKLAITVRGGGGASRESAIALGANEMSKKLALGAMIVTITATLALGTGVAGAISAQSPTFHGGPVLSGYRTAEVIWSHGGTTSPKAVTEGLGEFLGDVAAASGTTENVFAMLPQYSTQGLKSGSQTGNQIAAYRSVYLGSTEISPSTGAAVTLPEIETALSHEIAEGRLPVPVLDAGGEPETVYTVALPPNMELCVGSECSGPKNGGSTFCSLRGSAHYSTTSYMLIAILDHSGVIGGGCENAAPTQLAEETSTLTQQLGETIADPFIVEENFGWVNSEGLGIGYICNAQIATDTIDGHSWTVQKLWSNEENNCVGTDGLFKPPTADFSATHTENKATFAGSGTSENHLANVSSGIASYSWDFGDGQRGTGQSPTHAYAAGGEYTVTLTATDSLGFTAHATHKVVVSNPPATGGGGPTGGGPTSGGGSTTTPGPSGGGKAATVSLTGSASTATAGGGVVVNSGETVQCPREGGLCVVTVQATAESAHLASGAKKHKSKNRKLVVGSATLTLSPGASAVVTFKLNATGKRLLKAHGHLLVKLTVTVRHGSDTPVVSTRTLRLSAPKRHGHK